MLEYAQPVATRFLVEEDGQAVTEYALIVAIVSVIGVALLGLFGADVTGLLNIVF